MRQFVGCKVNKTFSPFIALACLALTSCSGDAPRDTEPLLGRWQKAPEVLTETALDEAALKRLSTLGYLSGYTQAGATDGVTILDLEKAFDGYHLYVAGHGPEARLMDMKGEVLHTWRKKFLDIWPDWEAYRPTESKNNPPHYFVRSYLYPNGDLLAMFEGYGLVKLDRNSNILWTYSGSSQGGAVGCHHDFWVDDTGSITVLTYTRDRIVESINKKVSIWEDYVAVLDSDGHEQERYSLLECFLNSDYAPLLEEIIGKGDHALHTNSIQVFDGSLGHLADFYQRGNILVSCRENDVVAIVDPRQRRVVWAMKGMWMGQHSVRLLRQGTMLLFDNKGNKPIYENWFVGTSRILEFNPISQRIIWQYPDESTSSFFCPILGVVEQVANGNRIVTDSFSGRAFEVTRENEIVWEWISPHRAGKKHKLIATLCQMTRIPGDFPLDWLERNGGAAGLRKAGRTGRKPLVRPHAELVEDQTSRPQPRGRR